MLKSKVLDIFGRKKLIFWAFCAVHRFSKTWHILNFNFTLIRKFNLENQILYLCPNVARFLKNVFIQQIREHLKTNNLRTSILRWLGRESLQNVARTRK